MTDRQTTSRAGVVWRVLGAALGVLITYLSLSTGLARDGFAEAIQIGLFTGVVAGVLAPSFALAPVASGAGLCVGLLTMPPWFSQDNLPLMLMALAAGLVVSAVVGFVVSQQWVSETSIAVIAVAVLVVIVIALAGSIANSPQSDGFTEFDVLRTRPVAGQQWDDGTFYRAVVWNMRDGMSYLDAYRQGFHDNARWAADPDVVFAVRTPLLFWLWRMSPGWPISPFWLLLALTCASMLVTPFVLSPAVSPVLGIPAAAALAVYALGFMFAPGLLFLSEIWGGLLAVLVLAAYARSQNASSPRPWMLVAVAIALLAALVRELMVFLLLAGLVAAFFGGKKDRQFAAISWGSALGVFLLAWLAHYASARRILTPIESRSFMWFKYGGWSNLYAGVTTATQGFRATWIPAALVVLGVLGALAARQARHRAFAVLVVGMPLVGFLFAGTDAVQFGTGIRVNYWGAIVLPSLLVLAPAALGWIPGMRGGVDAAESAEGVGPASAHGSNMGLEV